MHVGGVSRTYILPRGLGDKVTVPRRRVLQNPSIVCLGALSRLVLTSPQRGGGTHKGITDPPRQDRDGGPDIAAGWKPRSPHSPLDSPSLAHSATPPHGTCKFSPPVA